MTLLAALAGKFRNLQGHKEFNYTQQDARDIIERNDADDNAAFMRLAERLIQQQDAAVSSPTFPSPIRSMSGSPRFWYFLATSDPKARSDR